MPRDDRQQVTRLPDIGVDPQRVAAPTPVAHAVDTFVHPAVGQTQALIEALAKFNPALERYQNYKDLNDTNDGAEARARNEDQDTSKGASWMRGYMRMDGAVKAEKDGAGIIGAYNTTFDKDSGDIEQFIKDQVGALTQGVQDKPFLDGYTKSLQPTLVKLREAHYNYHVKQLSDTAESNAMSLIESGVRGYVGAGEPVPDDFIEKARANLGTTMGVSNARFNDLLFGSVKRLGDEGNYAVYDMFKRNRPDGTPGMYYIPKWKEQIDQAQIHSQNVFLENQTRAHAMVKQQREDRQDTALFSVFDKLTNGDETGARADFNVLRNDRTLFSKASDVIKWEKLFDDTSKREATPEMQANETQLLAGAYRGDATSDDVLRALHDGKIDNKGARRVLGDMSKIRSEQRSAAAAERSADAASRGAAAAERAAGRAIYQSPEFKSGLEYLQKGVLASKSDGLMDPFGVGSLALRQMRETVGLEFTQRAKDMNPSDISALRDEMTQRYSKQRKIVESQGTEDVPGMGLIRYPNRADAIAAARRGELSTFDLQLHAAYFKELTRRGRATK